MVDEEGLPDYAEEGLYICRRSMLRSDWETCCWKILISCDLSISRLSFSCSLWEWFTVVCSSERLSKCMPM